MKTCRKGLHQYEPVKGWKHGCTECEAAKKKAWYEANKERAAASGRSWYEANKALVLERSAARVSANPERAAARKKLWRANNAEKMRAYFKAKYESDPLPDRAIARYLGFDSVRDVPPELIEAKRSQLKLKQLLKEMKK